MKIKRKVKEALGAQRMTHPASIAVEPSPPQEDRWVPTTMPDIRRTEATVWLEKEGLGLYAQVIQNAGYDDVADLRVLCTRPELFALLVPALRHREKFTKALLDGAAATQQTTERWLQGLPHETETNSTDSNGTAPPVDPSESGRIKGEPLPSAEPGSCESASATPVKSVHSMLLAALRNPKAPPKSPVCCGPVLIEVDDQRFDSILFVANPGLQKAEAGEKVGLCCATRCVMLSCAQLHFKTISVLQEARTVSCSCYYVRGVTRGLVAHLRGAQERVVVCVNISEAEEFCGSSSCDSVHISIPIEQRDRWIPMHQCSVTDALTKLVEVPLPLWETRKNSSKATMCSEFSLSQFCVKGTRCWNYHVMPRGFSGAFYGSFDILKLQRHCSSVSHLPNTSWDCELRGRRSSRKYEIGECLDFIARTQCLLCVRILFDHVSKCARRESSGVSWVLLERLCATADPLKDPTLTEVIQMINNTLQLPHASRLSSIVPIELFTERLREGVNVALRSQNAGGASGASSSGGVVVTAHVFWDYDNVLFTSRDDLTLFFDCLSLHLVREGICTNRSAIVAKAFGTQSSFDPTIVDVFRDLQVEMVLCSSKKQEETDRVMERAMRGVEGSGERNTVVIISSDKDFMSAAKSLQRSGVDVFSVHHARRDSHHEKILSLSTKRAFDLFSIYLAPLRPWRQRKPAPRSAVDPPAPEAVPGRSPTVPSPSSLPTSPSDAAPCTANVVDLIKRGLRLDAPKGPEQAPKATVNVLDLFKNVPLPPASVLDTVTLTSLVAQPQPPPRHPTWYRFAADSFLLRLLDRSGPGACRLRSSDAMSQMRVYVEMARLVPSFLPSWFDADKAVELVAKRVDDPPHLWLDDEAMSAVYEPSQFPKIRVALRLLAARVDGPLEDAPPEEWMSIGSVVLRY
jgi:hypothetical protein